MCNAIIGRVVDSAGWIEKYFASGPGACTLPNFATTVTRNLQGSALLHDDQNAGGKQFIKKLKNVHHRKLNRNVRDSPSERRKLKENFAVVLFNVPTHIN